MGRPESACASVATGLREDGSIGVAVAYTHHWVLGRVCAHRISYLSGRVLSNPGPSYWVFAQGRAIAERDAHGPAKLAPMSGPRRARARGGSSDRRAGAHRPRRTRQASKSRRHVAPRVSWSRRVGLAVALLVLAGGAIVFAGGALDAPGGRQPGSSAVPLPAPQIIAPEHALTRDATIDLTLLRPTGLDAAKDYTLRITVNGDTERERPLPGQEQFVVAGIALTEGENSIRAALVGKDGVGAMSVATTITRDTTAPVIRVTRPEPDAIVYSDTFEVRGRTEAGATLDLVDVTSGAALGAAVDSDGRFSAQLTLTLGDNPLLLTSRDLAGNTASTRIVIKRADSHAAVTLTVSDDRLKAEDLPQRLVATVFIQDERGQPVDGAAVTFSVSPPNATTMTYRTASVAGQAEWSELDIASADDPLGSWLVTVLVELPSGMELRANKSITVR
jgi:hypothetical protein